MPTPPRQRPLRRLAPLCGLLAAALTALLACLTASAGAAPAAAATASETARQGAVTGGAGVRVVRRSRAAARAVNPLARRALYLEPTGFAARQADAWQGSRPGDADLVRWIAGQPQGLWLGEWHRDVRAVVARRMRAARAGGTVPVLVIYNIPDRDCGQHSGGGAPDGPAYLRWIERVAAGIGPGPATVVLEPDALAGLACLPRRARAERTALMAAAVDLLTRGGGTAVYIDAGNPGWVSARAMARRLRAAGVTRARGFALNVSSFETTARVARYGRAVSRRTGRSHFVVDTSRNGNGPDPSGAWCNPPGRALGAAPTTDTGDPLIDAFLWVKRPGESDGTCNGGPPAGTWWPEYALDLARRAQIAGH
ncbi:MAG: glycoside hydrolase family 6 protein [Thermoleophilia bacterium]